MVVSRGRSRLLLGLLVSLAVLPAWGADKLISLDVALGDASLNKVPFLIAADTGIYARNGLDVHQYITPGAAEVARHLPGVSVPARNSSRPTSPIRADRHRRRQSDDLSPRQ